MIYGALFLSIILQCCIKRVKLKALHEERIPVELNLRNGRIRGFESIFLHRRIHSFLSVPFAEPPIGEDRFRPPKPKKPWSHTLKTSELSPACYQVSNSV
ncbi:hypothetical protein AB6A40_007128 [Gnathostoma spinigerum]|uniref:Carboxylesterase type B domain-containing protein n=1 Tax=Gnathostoma spinigerum TaxID=75299 RepID=A0ABD6ESZ7_9BILA